MNSINNISNVNFKAKRIVSVTRFIDKPMPNFEKIDIYKINENDIPFMKKVVTFLAKRKNKLNDMQKQLYEHFKEILNDKYAFDIFYNNRHSTYLGIKNDSYITGFMKAVKGDGEPNTVKSFYTTKKHGIFKDSFYYAIWKDTKKGKVSGCDKYFGRLKEEQLPNIKKKYSNYNFDTSKPKKEYDLEEVLGLKE